MINWFIRSILALLIGLVGVIVYWMPLGVIVEEKYGLSWLFHFRGAIPAPTDVIVIALDQLSASELDLPLNPKEWPRDRHADLIDKLGDDGAEIIAFDLRFSTCGSSPESNEKLAHSIKKASNVVLVERLIDSRDTDYFPYRTEKKIDDCQTDYVIGSELDDTKKKEELFFRDYPGLVGVWRLPILPIIAEAARGTAPFILPRGPVTQYWAFNASAGDIPSLPSVMLQIFALKAYDDFVHLLHFVEPLLVTQIPTSAYDFDIEDLMFTLRDAFVNNEKLIDVMQHELDRSQSITHDNKKIIHALLNLYSGSETRYLNFYGPPRTIRTIPYHQVLQSEGAGDKLMNLKGKIVFIGVSAGSFSEQDELRDDYATVFNRSDGLQISGVEIAATAFINLLDGSHIRPLPLISTYLILFLSGFTLCFVFLILPDRSAMLVGIILVLLYGYGAYYLFKTDNLWLPVVMPLVQALLAFGAAVLLKYAESVKERHILREAFGKYVPEQVVNDFVNNAGKETAGNQLLYGICMDTDADQYTELGGRLSPTELRLFMNDYYATLFRPVKQYGGIVSDIKGDAMLALWAASTALSSQRRQACFAALEIIKAVELFNLSNRESQLPTRIGLHADEMTLGNVGAIHHYEYRAVGDIVNTTNRIQGANKYFKTRLLLSKAVLEDLDDFLVRPMGKILLSGKTIPIDLAELIACKKEINDDQIWLCEGFANGLRAYESQNWASACDYFSEILQIFPDDGPSRFFLNLCQNYRLNPPLSWDGITRMPGK
ncbi:CHASE2 domain-containing protein [Nitrosomonas communis]|uniref:Adenylate cyclase n=1 Tax=Nitrosomonas communis TaxID=44574 RepID=A0A1H2X8J7_9PROT|nr:adenylate/guanylate cyclase domain-containing protein [Nitrosomonas communis]SDW88589.1 adenylate cyclase [Nitrosomonas communis]